MSEDWRPCWQLHFPFLLWNFRVGGGTRQGTWTQCLLEIGRRIWLWGVYYSRILRNCHLFRVGVPPQALSRNRQRRACMTEPQHTAWGSLRGVTYKKLAVYMKLLSLNITKEWFFCMLDIKMSYNTIIVIKSICSILMNKDFVFTRVRERKTKKIRTRSSLKSNLFWSDLNLMWTKKSTFLRWQSKQRWSKMN